MPELSITINQTELVLLPEKLLYLPDYEILCLSDWHLGKAAHFRKAGIPVPQPDLPVEFDRVTDVMKRYRVGNVLFLGDLFHSAKNNDWDQFAGFVGAFSGISFTLIRGNHDIIPAGLFNAIGVEVLDELICGEKVIFTHEPLFEQTPQGLLNIAGHVHPGYTVTMKARQRFTLPCYHYSRSTLVLPAFGGLTGLYPLRKAEGHSFFCIVGDEVVAV